MLGVARDLESKSRATPVRTHDMFAGACGLVSRVETLEVEHGAGCPVQLTCVAEGGRICFASVQPVSFGGDVHGVGDHRAHQLLLGQFVELSVCYRQLTACVTGVGVVPAGGVTCQDDGTGFLLLALPVSDRERE